MGVLGPEALAVKTVFVEQVIRSTDTGLHTTVGNAKDGEGVAGLVVLEVAQDVGQVVGALLGEVDVALADVGVEDGQAQAVLAVGLHRDAGTGICFTQS